MELTLQQLLDARARDTDTLTPAVSGLRLVERLRQVARRHRQYGAAMTDKFDISCALTMQDLDDAADELERLRATEVSAGKDGLVGFLGLMMVDGPVAIVAMVRGTSAAL